MSRPASRLSDGLTVRAVDEVQDKIDPRITEDSIPRDLEKTLPSQIGELIRHHERPTNTRTSSASEKSNKSLQDILYVDFEDGDPANPANFSKRRKWIITFVACYATAMAGMAASAFATGIPTMVHDVHCSRLSGLAALSVFTLGFALTPLVTASFSEEFGRNPLYFVSGLGFTLMYAMIALAKNLKTVMFGRFLQGVFGSTGSTMVGGTIADIWAPHERGMPMTLFSVACFAGVAIGPMFAGFVEMNESLGWRWIQWIQMILAGIQFLLVPICMRETRAGVLLTRKAKKIRRETGDGRYRARIENERASLRTLIFISCTRPVYLLFREPIVLSFSLWIGFAWGIFYVFIESINGTFQNLHGFSVAQSGMVFSAMLVGVLCGVLSNIYQERLFHEHIARRGPEARMYLACFAGVLFPASIYIYAWCAFPQVPWIAQAIAIVLFIWAAFIMYLAVFTYLADCYGPFASSALAGQSLSRNLAGTAFPLFTEQMFARLSYKWACTIFAGIATVMVPIPFILFFYGPTIRKRSEFSSRVIDRKQ